MNKTELLDKIQRSWDALNQYLASLTDEQRTTFTDAGGWTVKDHVMHLAAWEDGLTAKLDKQNRRVHMGIDEATWESGDDAINAVMQKRYQALTWAEVEQKRQVIHTKLLGQIAALGEETLEAPFSAYDPNSPSQRTVEGYIGGSTYYHYDEHRPWIAAIAESKS